MEIGEPPSFAPARFSRTITLKQQYQIYLTALGSERKDDSIKIAILLKFAGEDAIEVFNTFQFPEGDENNKITLADL